MQPTFDFMWRHDVSGTIYASMSFYLGAQDSSLKLWDLRKLKNFKTITLDNQYEVGNYSLWHTSYWRQEACWSMHILPNVSLTLDWHFFFFAFVFGSGEIPRIWPERYLLGCRRIWHPSLHLQAVVWGPQLHRWEDKIHFSYLFVISVSLVFTWLFLSVSRPHWIGDWSSLWR